MDEAVFLRGEEINDAIIKKEGHFPYLREVIEL